METVQNEPKITRRIFGSAIFGIAYVVCAALTAIAVLFALSGSEGEAERALPALQINLILILALGAFLIMRLKTVLYPSNAGQRAPRLHRRFVLIFSLGALIPAIFVGLFFSALMSRNLNDVFGPSVMETMKTSQDVSDVYLTDQIDEIRRDVYSIADDLNSAVSVLPNRITYTEFLITQAVFREHPAVYVLDGKAQILARAEGPTAPSFVPPTQEVIDLAADGALTLSTRNDIDYIVALYKLNAYEDAYVYTGRYVRAGVLNNIEQINRIEQSLEQYTGSFGALNRVFLITYIEAALLIAYAAIWLGLLLANRLVSPLGDMVDAAEKVRGGDLTTRINVTGTWDEIGDLASAFNRMTRQLSSQRQDLVREHDISERRREFSEAVLSGVSAGVVGLSPEGKITIINRSAETLLGLRSADVIGRPIDDILPSLYPVFKSAKNNLNHQASDQVNLETFRGLRHLDVRVSPYKGQQANTGWVMTFDDMTRLVAAQRHSAWREVARRIAHEIKNPLTPIQLSAERLERKYKDEITKDPHVFSNCTETILRQVNNLGRMVDEFSAFARMPAPVLESVTVDALLRDTLLSQRVAFPEIEISIQNNTSGQTEVLCDQRLIGQALTNLLKNASESILRRLEESGYGGPSGRIEITISTSGDMVCIDIIDNGSGWPVMDKERLLEPYMTTRDEGTGLGLAIVKRIAEDHGGSLELLSLKGKDYGAQVAFSLPLSLADKMPDMPQAHSVHTESYEPPVKEVDDAI